MTVSRTAAVLAVGAILFTGGCGSNDHPKPADVTRTTASDDLTAVPRDAPEYIIHNGARVSGPETLKYAKDEDVRFTIISDKDDQLHIHGYDKEVELKAGDVQTVEFKADIPGKFEIEIHSNDSLVTTLEIVG